MKTASFETCLQSFLEHLKVRNYSAATLDAYGYALRHFFAFATRNRVGNLRGVSLEKLRDYQLELHKSQYRPTSIYSKLQAVRQFFNYHEKQGRIAVNPFLKMTMPKLGERLPRNVLAPSDVRAILAVPDVRTHKGIRDKAILELFYSTGIRLGEMIRLSVCDADYGNGFLRINQGKGCKDRVVPIGQTACEALRQYLTRVYPLWERICGKEKRLWLSAHQPHQPMGKMAVSALLCSLAKAAGMDRPATAHVWRHSCASHMVGNGSDVVFVQKLLGHRSLKTTAIYTRVTLNELKETHRKAHPRSV
ncbi:MAG: tyrosine-type recombinase/integrase [Verrucomicrobiae bacterium]|nr:tyrosine-type recombinase/integrase [Verrucomicrobiae bacterium]